MLIYKSSVFLLIFILISALSAFSGPLVDDVSEENRFYDILQELQDRGLVEGYPDGYFKGDRPLNRYEMAMAVARVIAKIEQVRASVPSLPDLSLYLSDNDIYALNNLIGEFSPELEDMGIRVNKIEDAIEDLSNRIEVMERVKVKGVFDTIAISSGYSPDSLNTSGFGTPAVNTGGPTVLPDRDRYKSPPGSSQLFQGAAVVSLLNFNIAAKISHGISAGGDFAAYSAFGEKGIIDQWGLKSPYSPLGQIVHRANFQAQMSTLWFDTDGDFDFRGSFGDYQLKNVSKNLFSGLGTSVTPLNGLHFSGTLYEKIDLEVFAARNINAFDRGNATGIPSAFRYLLAVPYNDGEGAIRVKNYGIAAPGQFDNYVNGIWGGLDFSGGRGHIEGAFLRLYEDYASNPALGIDPNLKDPPKDSLYYGLKGYYTWGKDKVKLYGEFNQTCFDYNLLDGKDGFTGSFYNGGVSFKLIPFRFYGEFIMVEPNYDPLAYHQHWEVLYKDRGGHHEGWGWKYGVFACNGTRFSITRPNRIGFAAGMNWRFGESYNGTLYVDFAYLTQVEPTVIRDGRNSFQEYDFLTGNPIPDTTGINIYGNQDYFFTENDPAKGGEYNIEAGGKYRTGDFYLWGYFEYHNFSRNYELRGYDLDISYCFGNAGVTYDITRNFSIQGYVEYVKCSGINGTGEEVRWSQLIPGFGLNYSFSASSEFFTDYKFYSYNSDFPADVYDSVPDTATNHNNYNANKLFTGLRIKF